jgi:hypothetical protein
MPILAMLPNLGPVEYLVILATLAVYFLGIWSVCRVCAKAGFPWVIGLLALVPVVNFGLLLWLAFGEWPALRGRCEGVKPPPVSDF